MKFKILFVLCFVMLFVSCESKIENKKEVQTEKDYFLTEESKISYKIITQEEAKKIIDGQDGYIILDVRTKEEYDAGHIPNAMLLPNEDIGSEDIDILPDKKQLILIYCRSGNRSKQAAQKLVDLGYENIMEFGGIIDWPYETVK
jgi:rhodanese-related sulfurtransferase